MSLHYPYEQEPAPGQAELKSLEVVRESLAADVVEILSAVTETTNGDPNGRSIEHISSSAGDRQTLLRAAVVDLEALDKRLHHARHLGRVS
ncbi:hypothetical protein [Arthrobacter sp. Br18]|uniref:hypothetical protein n=1 Tax=Arthrobacter sp. Br18 TaxID=1312954 RepID=UPI0004B47B80|nr:hypothetical protein [Arthrobacter sp. Br18]